jgi:metallo-beta-lactamase class B
MNARRYAARIARRDLMSRGLLVSIGVMLSFSGGAEAESIDCSQCEAWNREQAPFQIYGNTYYVGPRGLGSVLITSPAGHVIIDGALPQSAPLIVRNVETLGFKMRDVKVILNSHTHFDHAGGIAELQRLSGAKVIASDVAAEVLRSGRIDPRDPQREVLELSPAVSNVESLGARQAVQVGDLVLHVIHTPGHTPGGTSWRWQSCEGQRCLNMVYADSLTAVSDDSFKYSGDPRYPTAAADIRASIATLAAVPCDILIASHPERTGLWRVFDEQGRGDRAQLVDGGACARYAEEAREWFDRRMGRERGRKG